MTAPAAPRLTLEEILIVDADIHAHETPAAILPYMDAKWRPAMENLCRVEHRNLDIPSFCPGYVAQSLGEAVAGPLRDRTVMVFNAQDMRRDLTEFAIDIGVLFPDNFLKLGGFANAEYAMALTHAYHRWLKEEWLSSDNDLYGVIMATPQDPVGSGREIDCWADDERFAGIFLPTSETYPMWGNRRYDPIFEAAQRHDLPVFLHSVSGIASAFPFNTEQFYTGIVSHTCAHVFAMMGNLMNMMETGVPVRFPNLRVCFSEAGLTWVPFLRMRLDKEHNESRFEWPFYDDRPSKWIQGFYFATQPVEEPQRRQDLVDIIRIYDGEDKTVFASDWPHHDFDHPRAVFNLPATEVVKRKVMGANALKLMPRIRVPEKYQAQYRQGQTL